jgi:hypothetical protein
MGFSESESVTQFSNVDSELINNRQRLDKELVALEDRKITLIEARNQIDRDIATLDDIKRSLQSK